MNHLEPTYFFDFDTDDIQTMLSEFKDDDISPKEKAIGLYTAVRSGGQPLHGVCR